MRGKSHPVKFNRNLNRIPPVLAKPKPPPFNKGGFQQNRADNIRHYIINCQLKIHLPFQGNLYKTKKALRTEALFYVFILD